MAGLAGTRGSEPEAVPRSSSVPPAAAPEPLAPGEQRIDLGGAPRGLTRRAALALAGLAGGAAAAGGRVSDALAAHIPTRRRPTPDRPPPSRDLISYEEAVLAFRCHGFHKEFLDRPITPLGSHFLLIHFDIPTLDETHQLSIKGRVRNPMTLSLADLKRRPQVREAAIMECAGNGRSFAHPRAVYVPWFDEAIGVYEYTGTPLRPLLEEAGLLDDAEEVVFTGVDHGVDLGVHHQFEHSIPVDEALKDGVILAWEANGQPLLPAHGFPLRVIVPTWYGMVSVKWLRSITVINHPFQGVEKKLVYRLTFSESDNGRPVTKKAVRAMMKPPGFPDLLTRYRFLSTGRHLLEGMAWSGHGPIVRVEVSTNDRRTWRDARLEPAVSPHAWTPWKFEWEVTRPGEYILSTRATDAAGNRQPPRPLWNRTGMAQNGVERLAVRVR